MPECNIDRCGQRFATDAEMRRHRKDEHEVDYAANASQIQRIRKLAMYLHIEPEGLLSGHNFSLANLKQTEADTILADLEQRLINADKRVAG